MEMPAFHVSCMVLILASMAYLMLLQVEGAFVAERDDPTAAATATALERSPQRRASDTPHRHAAGDADTGDCSALTSTPWQENTGSLTLDETPLQQRTPATPKALLAAADALEGRSALITRFELLDGDGRCALNAMNGRSEAVSGRAGHANSPRHGQTVQPSCEGEAAVSLCEGSTVGLLCVGEGAAAFRSVEAASVMCRPEGASFSWHQVDAGPAPCGGEAAAAQDCQVEEVGSPDDAPAAVPAAFQGAFVHGCESSYHRGAKWDPCGSEAGSSGGCPGVSSCASDGGASAAPLCQAGQASNFSSILQHDSGAASAGACPTPESRQGTLGAQTGASTDPNPASTLPNGLSPLAVPATPAVLPSWLDRPAQAVPEAGIMAGCLEAPHMLQLVPPSSPVTPAWLRATPVPGVATAVLGAARGPPDTPCFGRLQECATSVVGVAALMPRAGPEIPSTPGTGHLVGCCGSAASLPGRTPGGNRGDLSSARALYSGAPGSAAAACSPCDGYAASSCGADDQPLALPDFQGFPAPLAARLSGQASPVRTPPMSGTTPDRRQGAAASTLAQSPEQGAVHVPTMPESPAALGMSRASPDNAQEAERSTLVASPDQGAARALSAPDVAERRLLGRLRAQLGCSPGPDMGHACARMEGAAAAAERRATFLRAIDRLQVCFPLSADMSP